eukprot:PhM_4_TR14310/c0_g1_i1/m.102961
MAHDNDQSCERWDQNTDCTTRMIEFVFIILGFCALGVLAARQTRIAWRAYKDVLCGVPPSIMTLPSLPNTSSAPTSSSVYSYCADDDDVDGSAGDATAATDANAAHIDCGRTKVLCFAAMTVHCFVEVCVLLMFLLANTSSWFVQTSVMMVPCVTYQTSLYLYLHVWQLQCATLDSLIPKPNVSRAVVCLWYGFWSFSIATDLVLAYCDVTNEMYFSLVFDIINYLSLACGFLFLGERVRESLAGVFGVAGDNPATNCYEHHVQRVRWVLGCGCLLRGVLVTLQMWLASTHFYTSPFFIPTLYFVVEMLPLAVSILSLLYVDLQRRRVTGLGSVRTTGTGHSAAAAGIVVGVTNNSLPSPPTAMTIDHHHHHHQYDVRQKLILKK